MGQPGKSAFNWDVYKNRKTALCHLKKNCTRVDTILETEDGSAYEFVHSQVISAFGENLTAYINQNGSFIEHTGDSSHYNLFKEKLKVVRLPKLNKYTLNVLVECAYTGYIRTDLASGGIWQVLEVATHYQMNDVLKACCAFLSKNLNRSNCVHFYHIGIRHKHNLQRNAFHQIRANFKHILGENLRKIYMTSNINSVSDLDLERLQVQLRHSAQQEAKRNESLEAAINNQVEMDTDEPAGENDEFEWRNNNLATMKYEHFEALLMDDKLNVDNEASVWFAIKLWCNYKPLERSSKITTLLPCMRFPRFRTGTDFSARHIWRDPLVMNNKEAQHQLAVLDRNHRNYLTSSAFQVSRDGFSLPCARMPRQLRPRIPHSILLAIGGWQQGQPTKLIEAYDVNCNLWFESQRKIMYPLAYHGIENIDGVLYICGGTDGNDILNELFTFNPVRGDCAQKPSMRESRCYVSTAYLDGHLYAIGGHNGVARIKSVERFEIHNENWRNVKDMNVARSDASACVHGQRIYIAGGLNDQVIESSVEFYNQLDDSWTFISSMITPRTSFTLLLYQSNLLAIGGNNGSERLASVEQYNFRTKLWSHHSFMRHRRSTFSAALLDEDKLIVVGGYNGQTPFNQVEMFDEETRSWIMLHKIHFDRSGLKVVVVSDLANATDYTFLGSQAAGGAGSGGAVGQVRGPSGGSPRALSGGAN